MHFDGDEQAYARPMGPLLEALAALGASVDGEGDDLPFTGAGTAWVAKVGPPVTHASRPASSLAPC